MKERKTLVKNTTKLFYITKVLFHITKLLFFLCLISNWTLVKSTNINGNTSKKVKLYL